ncbi:lysophospholipid acyltransferase family protein [Sediminicola luteus]|uniref:Lipid A biosynthesis acyltransferase n=1 Tax=Sediminicola luteus TaxID=319238 RepID=A0A2A4G757_9FLAO|nr:lipid A biosynthesis acyltransferase [Sediminicola luteus]PCE63826.1 lipid A biosynthesis acyltransferase [Sediminicola luteus]
MQLLVFLVVYPLLWLVSILPFPIFYAVSDGIFFLIFHIVGYRKKVVMENLKLTLPNKSEAELKRIQKDFYRHMCDMFMEMIKTLSISNSEIEKRFALHNLELLHDLEKKKNIILVGGHYANWEWAVHMNDKVASDGYGIYKKINNVYFDKMVKGIRAKWGAQLILTHETVQKVTETEKQGKKAIFGMLSDQSPQMSKAYYWNKFMGVNVPIFTGAEFMARKLDLAVVFIKVEKVKRGYYQATFSTITESGATTVENEITDAIMAKVEAQIKEKPEHYLWTHKRWKHRGKTPMLPKK